MILRPVRPQSPCGPPMTKRPVGLIKYLVFCSHSLGSTGLMISSMMASVNEAFIWCWFSLWSGLCWVDSTTVSMLCGLPST
ncbi:hypothetical protein FQZ97_1038400 [compost metagenome]